MKKIIGILVCTLLITTVVPTISGITVDNNIIHVPEKNIVQMNAQQGKIDPVWISYAGEYESYDDMRAYENHIYVAGRNWDPATKKSTPFVCKFDSTDGSLIWKSRLTVFEDSAVTYDIEVFDQGIYVTGFIEDLVNPVYEFHFYLWKLNFDGEILWYEIITEDSYNAPYSIEAYNDYLYICGIGRIDVVANPRLIKMDLDGNIIFKNDYNATNGYLHNIKIHDGYIYCAGQAYKQEQDYLVMKFDLEGNLIWHQIWGGPDHELGIDLDVTDDYLYITGYGGGSKHDYFLKYDHDGVLQWETHSGLYINGLDVAVHDGYAFTTGSMYTINNRWEVVLCKYDLDSNFISYLTGPSNVGRDLEIYEDYLYMTSWDFLLKYDMEQNPDNRKPNKPSTLDGPTNIFPLITYDYSTAATDPDGDNVSYDISWGDGKYTSRRWYESGKQIEASHRWIYRGNYDIKVRARDEFGMVSEWSDPLKIGLSRERTRTNMIFMQFFELLQKIFPRLNQFFNF
jgi:hypothetical protein